MDSTTNSDMLPPMGLYCKTITGTATYLCSRDGNYSSNSIWNFYTEPEFY